MTQWKSFFTNVLVPLTGLAAFIYAGLGGPVPLALYPLVGLLIGVPGLKWIDGLRRNGNGGA